MLDIEWNINEVPSLVYSVFKSLCIRLCSGVIFVAVVALPCRFFNWVLFVINFFVLMLFSTGFRDTIRPYLSILLLEFASLNIFSVFSFSAVLFSLPEMMWCLAFPLVFIIHTSSVVHVRPPVCLSV